ncbi:hypothetical protein TWF225_001743 [Orbilia oligospora]|nr:hypothetical protein TWF225_001743 [Orbilia oligospora]
MYSQKDGNSYEYGKKLGSNVTGIFGYGSRVFSSISMAWHAALWITCELSLNLYHADQGNQLIAAFFFLSRFDGCAC